ncbi:MAG: M20 family metallopeptidase [Pseudomonadota bacterium]
MAEELLKKLMASFSEDELVKMISRLVAMPSHPGVKNQETGVAELICDILQKEGIYTETIPVIDGRSNVVARLMGTGNGRTLLLTGHTDTVPPYDMPGNPYEIRVEDGKMYGRGVLDMKGPLGCMMMAMIAIKRSGIKLAGDIVFAGVIDEEDKSEGTRALLNSGLKADGAIVGEPSEMEICLGHRGLEWFEFTFHGKAVHGGNQKEGINAILMASKFIERVERDLIPDIEKRVHKIAGSSSMNYGLVKGGTQPSTVAGECILQIDRRWIPGERFEDIVKEYQRILDELHKEDPKFKGTFKVMDVSLMSDGYIHEAMEIEKENPVVTACTKAISGVTGHEAQYTSFKAWTDGGLISSYGKIPTIVVGPGYLESAHSAGEHIEIGALVPAALIYALTAVDFCS